MFTKQEKKSENEQSEKEKNETLLMNDLKSIFSRTYHVKNLQASLMVGSVSRTVKASYSNFDTETVIRTTVTAPNYGIDYIEYRTQPEKYYPQEEKTVKANHKWLIAFNTVEDANKCSQFLTNFHKSYVSMFDKKEPREENLFYIERVSIEETLCKLVEAKNCPAEVLANFDIFNKYYNFYNHSNELIRYPFAAYATVYANQWVKTEKNYNWLDKQAKDISYKEIVDYFKIIAKQTKTTPLIFDINFRSLVQLLAILSPIVSIETLQEKIPHIKDIEYNPYGFTVGVTSEEEKLYVVETLEKEGLIISNISTKYPNKYLIWVITGSEYRATSDDLAYPNCMQQYWVNRASYGQNQKNKAVTSSLTQNGLFKAKEIEEEDINKNTYKI